MEREKPSAWERKALQRLLLYQFGVDFDLERLGDKLSVERSRRTGRIRKIFVGDTLFASVRLSDGFIVPTPEGWRLLLSVRRCYFVEVPEDVARYVSQGRTVFSKHVIEADREILPGDEVAVISGEEARVSGSGKAMLPGDSMGVIRRGKAIKTRTGAGESE